MEDFDNEALAANLDGMNININANDNDLVAADVGIQDGNDGNDIVRFHYTDGKVIPKNATHVTVDSSVRRLCDWLIYPSCYPAYFNSRLTTVELPEGLESIGNFAFSRCVLLTQINIPSTVKVIGKRAFGDCESLESVVLPEGLEQLGGEAFIACASLLSINIPLGIKAIKSYTFRGCASLRDVELSEGLESIGYQAFSECPMLRHISIPPTVKEISPYTFNKQYSDTQWAVLFIRRRTNLERVQFCDIIEEFVSGESIRDWWDNGTSERSLKMYNFLIRCKVPERLEQLMMRQWQANIHEMIKRIPSFKIDTLDDYLNTIDSTLVVYESLPDVIPLLEFAIWKSNTLEQHGLSKSQFRIECGCDIILHVLSFL